MTIIYTTPRAVARNRQTEALTSVMFLNEGTCNMKEVFPFLISPYKNGFKIWPSRFNASQLPWLTVSVKSGYGPDTGGAFF